MEVSAERWERAKVIVADALEISSIAVREAFVRQECKDDFALLSEVESLLSQTTTGFDQVVKEAGTRDTTLTAGRRIDRYEIIRELGRGGMGAVYLARRADGEFDKQVAIKLLKRGTDTDEILRRFNAERQIVARLQHPNIASLLDAGTTLDGLPYFVMEYVDGLPITQFARELSLNDRLKLFQTVCSAVSYAHRNLVIHRDLKPGNVLVTREGEVKLLDFGIAKLLQADEPNEYNVTVTMFRVMTPEYASPEQLKGDPITTLSDVYSLGILLYELLTGCRPYRVKTRSQEEVAKAITEQEPKPPSTVTDNREWKIDNPKSLRGDLDNIVLKAMRKEPERRYSSVDELSADIRRHLEGLPVRARKDTTAYRMRKFVRRHKAGVAAAALIFLALLGGSFTTYWQARRADRRFNEVHKIANSLMFELHDSIKDLPGALHARQLLTGRALEYLDSLAQEAGNDPSLKSELAIAYDRIGSLTFDVRQAIESHEKAVALNEALVRHDPKKKAYREQLSESYDALSDVMIISGQSRRAIDYARKAIDLTEKLARERPGDKAIQAQLAERYNSLGIALIDAGMAKETLQAELAAMRTQQPLVESAPSDTEAQRQLAGIYGRVSDAHENLGDLRTALTYSQKQLEIVDPIFNSDPGNARYRRSMWDSYLCRGRQLTAVGDSNGAEASLARARELMESLAGADPADTGHLRWLAVTYKLSGDLRAVQNQLESAFDYYRKATAITEKLVHQDTERVEAFRDLTKTYEAIGLLYARMKQRDSAMEYLRKAEALATQSVGRDPDNLRIRNRLAKIRAEAQEVLP